MSNKEIFIIFSIFLLLIILPSSFALNDENSTINENMEVLSESDDSLITDYYFNASVEKDGDGSKLHPYKYLTSDKLVDGSTIHLADGEYELHRNKTFNSLSIIGESSQKSVIKFTDNDLYFNVKEKLNIHNLTFDGVTILNFATINATNTIFKNSIAHSLKSTGTDIVNSASNSFGGVIYSPGYEDSFANVYLNNCTFINNTGEYGGAIYMYGGYLNIKNTQFLDNYAYNYGGAIACEYNSQVIIDKSNFTNTKSLNDAGGAIYIKSSSLTANQIMVSNSKSTFGGAITALSSTVSIGDFKAIKNTAQYEGGVIYQMYGTLTIRNSNFINNSANNGGALFIDNTTSVTLYQNNFINNTAFNYAGAVYSLFNLKSKINFNKFDNNHAEHENDLYETSTLSLVIGNGNYTMYKYNFTNFDKIPSRYSLLEDGFVTSVKDQQSGGNCWAFAGIAVLESCILKASGDNLDLSEENMKNLIELYSDYGWSMNTNNGGYDEMILAYLLSWMGPILEEDDLNDDYSTLSPLLNSIMHVQNVKYIKRNSFTDNDGIKEAILKYGAIGTGIYFDSAYYNKQNSAYYCTMGSYTNHAVAIVGWDDNYSRTNFNFKPKDNGAWIVKNSWNADWGDNGYFYVSYYDTSFAAVGQDDASYTFILNDTIKYDKNYQYDIIGKTDYFVNGNNSIWYQNVFNATGEEFLAGVSTYFEKSCQWELSIMVNDILKLTKNGTACTGYYTIDLENYIKLHLGDVFKVIFKITADKASFPISEKVRSNKILYTDGISFFSNDGINWIDLCDYKGYYLSHTYDSQVACIKAFTYTDEIKSNISLIISDNDYNPVEIKAKVTNQFGNPITGGNVTFTVDGKCYNVTVRNGIAKLTLNLKEFSSTIIEASYNSIGYINSHTNASIKINRIFADLKLDINQNVDNVTLKITSSLNFNETVKIDINNESYVINLINGSLIHVLSNLKNDNYTVKISVLNETYAYNKIEENFTINLISTKILSEDTIIYYNGNYIVKLTDNEGNPLQNNELIFKLNNKTYKCTSDSDGKAILNISLSTGNYTVKILFNGNNYYLNSSAQNNIIFKSSIQKEDTKSYLFNTGYMLRLLNNEGNPLSNTFVTLNVAGNNLNLKTDSNGSIYFNINLSPGTYKVSIVNPATGEVFNDRINVIPRIVDNNDLIIYFKSGAYFKVKIIGDNGQPVGFGKIVIFKIKNKSYKIKTDKNGVASFKITLKPNKYKITATYNGFTVSNKITVKPVLTAKNISKKKSKKIKYTAKLINSKGKPVSGKKIIFKVKNKVYKAKTNKKGVAKVYLKNLKIGKNKIIIKYGVSKIKRIVKIKR